MKIMVISPHPDDETLGAGGTLLRMKSEGHQIFWLNVTAMTEDAGYTRAQIDAKEHVLSKVREAFGFDGWKDLKLTATRLESYDSGDIIPLFAAYMDEVCPGTLILPNPHDAHSDHKRVFEWAYACTKRFRHPYIKKVMAMEIPSETDFGSPFEPFQPNYYVDITEYFNKKISILSLYDGELDEHPFPRSLERVEALARVRGGGEPCVEYAEAFRILKEFA